MEDEMKIKLNSAFTRSIVAKIIMRFLSKKMGCKTVYINLKDVQLEKKGDRVYVHIDANADIDYKELLKITRVVNMEDDN